MSNKNLNTSFSKKDDEFYTRYEDIKAELSYYSEFLKGKTIYLPCDDYKKSNFYIYLKSNFKTLGLKKLIATNYKRFDLFSFVSYGKPTKATYKGNLDFLEEVEYLKGDGDFLSSECTDILNECDLVITNPPFSLAMKFLDWILASKKDYLFVGHLLNCAKPNYFDEIFNERMFFGVNTIQYFIRNSDAIKQVPCNWYTNFNHGIKKKFLDTGKSYLFGKLRIYGNRYNEIDALDIPSIKEIPMDYYGLMGVPITFFPQMNREQFELLGTSGNNYPPNLTLEYSCESVFSRLFIKHKQ